jgi:hypothetical protein
MENGDAPIPDDIRPTPKEIIALCRSDLEVMYNLEFLFRADAEDSGKVRVYADLMSQHLERVNKILCGKLPTLASD